MTEEENMEIRNLTTFLKIADCLNFSKAASELGYAQSTVTMQIQQLETELNVRLFERIGKHVRITAKGEELLPIARQILAAEAQAKELGKLTSQKAEGTLRLGVVESIQNILLPGIIHRYHKLYPHVQIIIKAENCMELMEMLMHNEIDFIFTCSERLRSPQLVCAWERKEPMHFVASPDHPLSKKMPLTFEDLAAADFLQTEPDLSYGLGLNRYFSERGKTLPSFLEVGNPEVVLALIKQNDGISCFPEYVIKKELENKSIVSLPYEIPEISMWLQLFYHKNKWLNTAMNGFLELIRS